MGRSYTPNRCERCQLALHGCFCPILDEYSVQVQQMLADHARLGLVGVELAILMHWRESFTTTNTGRWASRLLAGQVFHRGMPPGGAHDPQGRPLESVDRLLELLEHEAAPPVWVLFPSEQAQPLTAPWVEDQLKLQNRPSVRLIVPDGTWKQASKIGRRELSVGNRAIGERPIIEVKLAEPRPSRYQLRHSPHAQNISTFEAVAQAAGVILGAQDPARGRAIDRVMSEFFDRAIRHILTIKGRGV